jgi:ribosomal protein S18 acetylase RimI-like enzyme
LADVIRLVRSLEIPIGDVRWPPSVELAPFSAKLAPAAHQLLGKVYENGRFGSVPEGFDTWWAAVRRDSEFDASLCFCAVDGDVLVGFALCWTSSFVKDFGVMSFYRRQGVGEALMRTAFRAFNQRGCKEVALKVRSDNATAKRFYGRLGFEPT